MTRLVKIPGYKPGALIETFKEKGEEYYVVEFRQYSNPDMYAIPFVSWKGNKVLISVGNNFINK